MEHELYKPEVLKDGITVTLDTTGYGAFYVRVRGADESIERKAFILTLSIEEIKHLTEIGQFLSAEKDAYETALQKDKAFMNVSEEGEGL